MLKQMVPISAGVKRSQRNRTNGINEIRNFREFRYENRNPL